MEPVTHSNGTENKKLFTVEQVNLEFPGMMYNEWQLQREMDGLSADNPIDRS
jgi:hypothetical protein